MKCFCDIFLTKLEKHMYSYGKYGIALTDENITLINEFKKSCYYKKLLNKYDENNISVISQPGYITHLGKQFKNICL